MADGIDDVIHFLENNSLRILGEAMSDAHSQTGPELRKVPEDDLQVAMYTVLLRIIDAIKERSGSVGDKSKRDVKSLFLSHNREMMDYIDGQSSYTTGHTAAVVRHVTLLAARANMTDPDIDDLEYAAWIHNIGLINQSRSIEELPRELTDDEMKQARNHTVVGAEMIRPIGFLAHLVPTVRYHHNCYDGSDGGPKGDRLPLGARIIAVADAYQAMIEPRAYRKALTRKEALDELVKESGARFDPQFVQLAHDLS